jgi:hypothetical protein
MTGEVTYRGYRIQPGVQGLLSGQWAPHAVVFSADQQVFLMTGGQDRAFVWRADAEALSLEIAQAWIAGPVVDITADRGRLGGPHGTVGGAGGQDRGATRPTVRPRRRPPSCRDPVLRMS